MTKTRGKVTLCFLLLTILNRNPHRAWTRNYQTLGFNSKMAHNYYGLLHKNGLALMSRKGKFIFTIVTEKGKQWLKDIEPLIEGIIQDDLR